MLLTNPKGLREEGHHQHHKINAGMPHDDIALVMIQNL
jgi:hypothetical protein